jgi:N-acetylglucosaminyl-diphospho-decaprenol L-rhamnosyltransferase
VTRDPRVAIVVVSRDRRELLLRTLPRHLALPEQPQVVLVDDASTDGTAGAVRAALPAVDLVQLDRSRGSAARNVGLRRVGASYVAFCDDDSWWEPGALRRAADLLDAHPRLAVINGRVLVGPRRRLDPVCAEMGRSALPRVDGQPGHPLLSFIACGVVVRRSALLAAGGFSERFGIGGEEELLAWDLAAAGWLLSYVPDLVAHHHPPPNDGRPDRRERQLRNALWTAWLRRPAPAALASTARALAGEPRDRTTARGLARAVAGLPWVLRERRVSPPHVEAMCRALEAR